MRCFHPQGSIGRLFSALTILALLAVLAGGLTAREIPEVKPESVGMSSEKLKAVETKVAEYIKEGKLAGATTLVARRGKIVHFQAHGMMDKERQKRMTKDAIFRIYSMTKSVATAAALILHDEGKLDVNDPVSKYLPEFQGQKVQAKDGLTKPKREVTIADLMRHSAGMTYGFFGNHPVDRYYRQNRVFNQQDDLKAFSKKLGKAPLLYSPGDDWVYSVSIDLLGHVVEVVSGQRLDVFLRERIFEPLDMKDTGFHVPSEKMDRFTSLYNTTDDGLEKSDDSKTSRYLRPPVFFSGGGGLVSTSRDYLRFLQMILNDGELHGTRLLKPATVKLMKTNQLSEKAMPVTFGTERREGVGFSLGFSVRVAMSDWDPDGRVGELGWGGIASTHYWTSPKDDLIVVTMEQTRPYNWRLEFGLKPLIYEAIVD